MSVEQTLQELRGLAARLIVKIDEIELAIMERYEEEATAAVKIDQIKELLADEMLEGDSVAPPVETPPVETPPVETPPATPPDDAQDGI